MSKDFAPKTIKNAIERAYELSQKNNNQFVLPEAFLVGLVEKDPNCKTVFEKYCKKNQIDGKDLIDKLVKYLGRENCGFTPVPDLSVSCIRIMQTANALAAENGTNIVEKTEFFFCAILMEDKTFASNCLKAIGMTKENITAHAKRRRKSKTKEESYSVFAEEELTEEEDWMSDFCQDLVAVAKEGKIDEIIGRKDEIERLIKTLNRRRKSNVVLVGEAGVGKTAVVEGLAMKIAKNEVPKCLKDYKIYALNVSNLLAGSRFRGDFEEKIKDLIAELKKEEKCILFIDEIHTVLGCGTGSLNEGLDFANMLKPALSRGDIRCIGATTYDEYKNSFIKDKAFARRFQKVSVNEPNEEETFEIIKQSYHYYKDHHKVDISDDNIRYAIRLSNKFVNDRFQPDKTFDIIDEAGSSYRSGYCKGKEITEKDIESVVCKWTNRKSVSLESDEKVNLKNLEENIKSVVFGQDETVEKIVKSIKSKKAGISFANTPLVYFFAGVSGVGKTELAKQIADKMNMNFLRFDMSEYSTEIDVTKLNGVAPGYVGFDQAGALTEEIIKNPSSVVLLDEIEKAHPKIFNMFLQVMDNGVMTDNNNRKADFKDAIIIMTSNVGCGTAEKKSSALGFNFDKADVEKKSQDLFKNAMNKVFTPEFRNRITATFYFNNLNKEHMGKIVDKFLRETNKNLIKRGVVITLDDKVKDFIVEEAIKLNMGGRPVKRLLTEHVEEKLVDDILYGKLENGGNVLVKMKDKEIFFEFDNFNIFS